MLGCVCAHMLGRVHVCLPWQEDEEVKSDGM